MDSSLIQLSDRLRRFREVNEYKQSGTFGRSFEDKSTSTSFVRESRLPGRLDGVRCVFAIQSVVSDTRDGSCLDDEFGRKIEMELNQKFPANYIRGLPYDFAKSESKHAHKWIRQEINKHDAHLN